MSLSLETSSLNPDVSVIVPTYNRIAMLEEALASVFAQEFQGTFEIIIIDDNSQDGTSLTLKKKYPNVRLITLSRNVGASAARNRGIMEAKGKYVAFLDSDDLWHPNYLEMQVNSLNQVEKGLCVSDLIVWYTDKNLKQASVQKPNLNRFMSPTHHLLVSNFIKTLSSIVVPRLAFEEAGLFDEDLKVCEDSDFYLRCILSDYQIIFSEFSGVTKREHTSEQLTDTKNLSVKEACRFRSIKKYYSSPKKKLSETPTQKRVNSEAHINLAKLYYQKGELLRWTVSYICAAQNSYPKLMLLKMWMSEARRLLQIRSKLSKLAASLKT